MRHKSLSTSDGNVVQIYDDVFSAIERKDHMVFIHRAKYTINKITSSPFSDVFQFYLKCNLNQEDLDKFGIFNNENVHQIVKQNVGDDVEIKESWFLACTSTLSAHIFHTDAVWPGCSILSYYVNEEWDQNWHGETLFANNSGECEIAVQYNPGRVIVYSADTFHASGPITIPDQIRYLFVCVLKAK
jgi:hypothetical protein